uniref:FLYWCH-type domain-containing protein n=1 Tax=Trichuris muris TaxID=70415 RepID=A0A5S6QG96_TRIMR
MEATEAAQGTVQPAQTSRTLSKRNREKLSDEGHLYSFDRMDWTSTKKFWRCDKRDSDGCKARVHTDAATGEVVKRVNVHCHGSDPGEVDASAVMTAIKKRAEETTETPAAIIKEALKGVSAAVLGQLPPTRHIRRTIQRRRAAIEAPPALPVSRPSSVDCSNVSLTMSKF